MESPVTLAAVEAVAIAWGMLSGALDVWVRRIPNALTLGAWALAIVWLLLTGHGLLGASGASCLGAAAVALILTLPGYGLGMLGAGDVKLLVAMGLLSGLEALLITFLVAGLLTGGAAILWIWAYRWSPWLACQLGRVGIDLPLVPEPRGRKLPFGLALAAGFVIAILHPDIR
jgi:Flp pilus assembly protein, protease CpaA